MISTPLNQHLAVALDPLLPDSLISDQYRSYIHSIGRHFPAAVTEFFGFECRLGEEHPRADFLFCSKAAEGGRDVLASRSGDQGIPEHFLEHPIWRQISAFVQRWADSSTDLYHKINNIWFEFDLPDTSLDLPIPCVFIGTSALTGQVPGTATSSNGTLDWFFQDTIPLLYGRPASRELEYSIKEAVMALPEGARIFQTGLMLGRHTEDDMMRICVRGLAQEQVIDYLRALGWQGCDDEMTVLISDCFSRSAAVDLDIDLAPTVRPKIGFECSFYSEKPHESKLPAFLDYLVDQNICLPAKREAVLAWPRGVHERTDPSSWPADLRMRSLLSGPGTVSMFFRWLYHIKLVYRPDSPIEAKAYLAVKQVWMTREIMDQVFSSSDQAANSRTTPGL